MNLQRTVRQVGKFAQDNSPLILTAVGAVGVVTTAYLSGRAGFKAGEIIMTDILERVDLESDEPPVERSLKEKFNMTWKVWIPPAIVGTISVASIIGANQIGTRRAAAMTTALALSERAFEEFRGKVVEKVGEKKANAIQEEVVKDRINRDPLGDRTPAAEGHGQTLCYEFYSGRYFYSDVETIRKAENTINHRLNNGHETASLTDLYSLLSLEKSDISDDVGWRSEVSLLDINIVPHLSDKGVPCLGVMYRSTPIREYWRFQG